MFQVSAPRFSTWITILSSRSVRGWKPRQLHVRLDARLDATLRPPHAIANVPCTYNAVLACAFRRGTRMYIAWTTIEEHFNSQATIATQLVRPVGDDFGLDAEDIGDNGHRQLGAFADAFPPFTNSNRNAEPIRNGETSLVPMLSEQTEENRGAKAIPAINPRGEKFRRTTTKVAWSKNELKTLLFLVPSNLSERIEPTDTRAQIEGCYEILRKHFRTTDHTQLDDHLDRYWTILHNSVTPALGLPTVAPIMLNLPNRSPSVQPDEELEFQYPPAEPTHASSGSDLSSRSPSIQPEEELELQYPPSEPVHLSSGSLGSAGSLPASNPCRNVPGLWFVKIKFVFEPEFTPSLDLPQLCVLGSCGLHPD
ncbi:hypothetical protein B0H14DRAFT_2697554 [Mycena olivaceomarginata]|nr:hypothetical protein B0H14DRAFT_2697554 [Mycena olivaceomarginata]